MMALHQAGIPRTNRQSKENVCYVRIKELESNEISGNY